MAEFGERVPESEIVSINMVLNVHRNHKAYYGRGEGWGRGGGGEGIEVGEEGDYIPIATLSSLE